MVIHKAKAAPRPRPNVHLAVCLRHHEAAAALQAFPFADGFHQHGTCGLVAMTSASHAEGRQFDPGQVYYYAARTKSMKGSFELTI